ncbi:MAG TPA: hypothetical protein VI636_04585 [Candidatus Angelobacter sp.]
MRRNIQKVMGCGLLTLIFVACVRAEAPSVDSILDQSYREMYNLQFDDAMRSADEAKKIDKTDPLPWVAQATAVLFREFDRFHILRSDIFISDEAFSSRPAYTWDTERKKQFEDALASAEKISRDRLARDKNDVKALFAMTLVNGLRANDAALMAKHNMASLSFTKTATGFAEKLLALSPNYYDAYTATGMGQYLIGSKPAPVRWILRIGGFKGDQAEGLKELTMAADKGRYLAPFARILLAFDDLRHQNRSEARKKFVWLHDQFPKNPLFSQEMAKCDRPSPPSGQ